MSKKIISLFLLCIIAVLSASAPAECHIYDFARIQDVIHPTAPKELAGTYSIIDMNESDLEWEDVEDWFFNYVKSGDKKCNYYLIRFLDSDRGVWASTQYVIYGAVLGDIAFGNISFVSTDGATEYWPKDGHLVKG